MSSLRRQNSRLKSRPTRLSLRANAPTIIRFRKSVTQWSICARFCTCAPARTLSRLFSVFAALLHRQSIAFSMNAGSFTYTPRFSPAVTARERARCSASRPLIWIILPAPRTARWIFQKTFSESPATLPSAVSFTARHLHLRSAIFTRSDPHSVQKTATPHVMPRSFGR